MTLLLFILFLALVLWVFFTPTRPTWMHTPEKINPQRAAEQVRERFKSTSERLPAFFKKKPTLGALLLSWAQSDAMPSAGLGEGQNANLADFRAWVASLPSAEVEAVAQECAEFCKAQRINLRWLLEGNSKPDMQKALGGLVVFFGLAKRELSGARASVALRAWQDAPLAKANFEFGKKLYNELVNAGLIAIPSHMLMAQKKERQTHLVNSIKTLIASDRATILPYAEAVINLARHTPAQPASPEAHETAATPAQPVSPEARETAATPA